MATKTKSLSAKQRELIRTNEDVRIEIAQFLGTHIAKVQTIYSWALKQPEKLANSPAAMSIIEKYSK